MERNFLLKIEYDGSGFSGWQRQPEARTVQGELEAALSQVMGKPVQIHGTSRTDAGVHALGQQASFSGEFGIPTERIAQAVNNAYIKTFDEAGVRSYGLVVDYLVADYLKMAD